MLSELHINNFALIDNLRLEFGPGFTVLTGETGAGKSIIVDALSAALGERTGAEVVRTGAEKCVVEAVFDLADDAPAAKAAQEFGFEPEDGLLILGREISRNGRSAGRVNGRAATASVLREITSLLLDVHGQHEHQSLLMVPLHVDIFDSWCGDDVAKLRVGSGDLFAELTSLTGERNRLRTDERDRARLLDLYKFQLDEIESARLIIGEEEDLATERIRLANAEKLFEAASEIYNFLGGAEGGAVDLLSRASGMADRLARIDSSMNEFLESVNTAMFASQEALFSIRDYRESVEANPARLEQIEDRLDLIRVLKKKYGDSIEEILAYFDDLGAKIDGLENAEERSSELSGKIDAVRAKLVDVCAKLTKARMKFAPEFQKAVEAELADLAMSKTQFVVNIEPIEPGTKGADAVEFLISANPGEPVRPLAKIASGGEMSRIMLALKTVMARAEIPTLVFDEIDTGIGGRTAQVLGDKIASLSNIYQILCVTHLPQIASRASRHYSIEKVVDEGRTRVTVRQLEGDDRVAELARMLGGGVTSAAAAEHAREMLSLADIGNN